MTLTVLMLLQLEAISATEYCSEEPLPCFALPLMEAGEPVTLRSSARMAGAVWVLSPRMWHGFHDGLMTDP